MSESTRTVGRLVRFLPLLFAGFTAPQHAEGGEGGVEPLRVDSTARGARIEGRVVDAKGAAIASARVAAYRWADVLRARGSFALGLAAQEPTARGTTSTDTEGRFSFPDLPSGMTLLIADVPVVGRAYALATAVAEHPVAVRLRVDPITTRVHGVVTDEHGSPIAQAPVVTLPPVLPMGGAAILAVSAWSVRTQTDASGRFEMGVAGGLEGLAAQRPMDGRWTAVEWKEGKAAEAGPSPSATIAFAPGTPLTGQVVGARSGNPIGGAGVIVVAYSLGGRTRSLQALTADASGRWDLPSFPPLAEGGFALFAQGIGGDWQASDGSREGRVAMRLGATLAGNVKTADGRPVAGARVLVHAWDWPALEATTDDAGAYEVAGLPRTRPWYPDPTHAANGLVSAFVDVPGYATDAGTVFYDIRPGTERVTQDFVLHPGAMIRGRVDPSDAGGTLLWSPGDPQPYGELLVLRGTTIGEEGAFVLADLPPGRVTLIFPKERRVVVDGLRAGETREGVQGPPPK